MFVLIGSELFSSLSAIFFGLSYVIPYIIRVRPFDRGFGYPGFFIFVWTGSMWYEFLAYRQPAWLYIDIILCFVSVVIGGWVYWPVVGCGALSHVFNGFIGWFPCVELFGNLGLGTGCFGFADAW